MDEERGGIRYIEWSLEEIQDFVAMIATEGGNNLKMRVYPRREGNKLFLLDAETDEPCGEYNYSRTCPPDCT